MGMRAHLRERLDHAGGVECLDPRTNDHGSASHTIVTTEPNELCAELHNRMPVILPSEAWPAWLGEEPADVPQLKALLAPYPSEEMVCWPVSTRVGNVKNSDPSLIEPIIPQ